MDIQHLCNSQEEAYTKIILHSLDVSRWGATGTLLQSPDTRLFVLAIHRYHKLCRNTYFVTGVVNLIRAIPLRPIVNALGAAKAEALLGFHVITRISPDAIQLDNLLARGSWAVGEPWADVPYVSAFAVLGTYRVLGVDTERSIEAFVFQLYEPGLNSTR